MQDQDDSAMELCALISQREATFAALLSKMALGAEIKRNVGLLAIAFHLHLTHPPDLGRSTVNDFHLAVRAAPKAAKYIEHI